MAKPAPSHVCHCRACQPNQYPPYPERPGGFASIDSLAPEWAQRHATDAYVVLNGKRLDPAGHVIEAYEGGEGWVVIEYLPYKPCEGSHPDAPPHRPRYCTLLLRGDVFIGHTREEATPEHATAE